MRHKPTSKWCNDRHDICDECNRSARISHITHLGKRGEKRQKALAYARHTNMHVDSSIMARVEHVQRLAETKGPNHRIHYVLRRIDARWRKCFGDASIPLSRTQRLNHLRNLSRRIIKLHPKCEKCEILFGPDHNYRMYRVGMCIWCYRRHKDKLPGKWVDGAD